MTIFERIGRSAAAQALRRIIARNLGNLPPIGRKRPDFVRRVTVGEVQYSGAFRVDEAREPLPIINLDEVDYATYDQVRWHPVVRDAILTRKKAAASVGIMFDGLTESAVQLAGRVFGPHIPRLVMEVFQGCDEFGHSIHTVEWAISMDVVDRDGVDVPRMVYSVERFAHVKPESYLIQVDRYGRFAGILPLRYAYVADKSKHLVRKDQLLHVVFDGDYGRLYGVPLTKAAVPYVKAWDDMLNAMLVYAKRYARPTTVGKHPNVQVSTPSGVVWSGQVVADAAIAAQEAGVITLPSTRNREGYPEYEITFLETQKDDTYVDKLKWLADSIRIAMNMPPIASSLRQEIGSLNTGLAILDVFLQGIETSLNVFEKEFNDQVVSPWSEYQFGRSDAVRFYVRPIEGMLRTQLLQALLAHVTSGGDIHDEDGTPLTIAWKKVAQDFGIPLYVSQTPDASRYLETLIREKLAQEASRSPVDGVYPSGTSSDTPQASEAPQKATEGLSGLFPGDTSYRPRSPYEERGGRYRRASDVPYELPEPGENSGS